MGEIIMKQLELQLEFGGAKIPDFNEWYSEVCAERKLWGDVPLSENDGRELYNRLLTQGFFKNGGYLPNAK
jgi:hypothetical protein